MEGSAPWTEEGGGAGRDGSRGVGAGGGALTREVEAEVAAPLNSRGRDDAESPGEPRPDSGGGERRPQGKIGGSGWAPPASGLPNTGEIWAVCAFRVGRQPREKARKVGFQTSP